MEVMQHFCSWHHGPMSKDHTPLLAFLSPFSGQCVLGHWKSLFLRLPTFSVSQGRGKFPLATGFLATGFEEFHLFFFLFYVYGYFVYVYLCAPMCLVPAKTGRGYYIPLELKLQITVSHCASAGN